MRVRARAGLAGVLVALGDAVGDGALEVGVLEDDVRGLAAELEGHALHGLRGQLADALAGAGGAGEGDHVDVRVGGDRLTDDRAEAGDEVEDAGGKPGGVDHFGQEEGVKWRDLARLNDDGAAGGERGRDLRGDLVQRVVPGSDAADDADRLADDERVADRLLELGLVDQDGWIELKVIIGAPAWISRGNIMTGIPTSLAIIVASSSLARAWRPAAMAAMYLARSSGGVCDQASKAPLAAVTALSMSSACPRERGRRLLRSPG